MKLKSVVLAVTSVVAVAGFSAPVASAQSSGDVQAPQTRAQCKKFLKGVDKALVWENKRYAKVVAKLNKQRAAATQKATTLATQQAEIERRMTEIQTALEDQANPLSDEEQTRLVDEYNSLYPTSDQNVRDLESLTDELEGIKFLLTDAKKAHTVNVRSTVKYRKQVATYCKRLKK